MIVALDCQLWLEQRSVGSSFVRGSPLLYRANDQGNEFCRIRDGETARAGLEMVAKTPRLPGALRACCGKMASVTNDLDSWSPAPYGPLAYIRAAARH
jgi:hypothetical protein